MKTAKKALLLTVCALVLVAATVMGTLAYLTSTDKVVNTFTVGKLAITLDEAPTDKEGNGTVIDGKRVQANDYKLMPGHHYVKDPIVHLAADSEACYVYVMLDNELKGAIVDGSAKGIVEQIEANGWTALPGEFNSNIWYKKIDAATAKAGTDLPVFASFDVDGAKTQTDLEKFENKTIKIIAYACQQDGFADAAEAWTACFVK